MMKEGLTGPEVEAGADGRCTAVETGWLPVEGGSEAVGEGVSMDEGIIATCSEGSSLSPFLFG